MLLIIDNYDSFTYNLFQIVASHAKDVQVVRNDKISVADIKQIKPTGIILSPGPGRPEQAGICVPLIKAMLYENFPAIPVLGVCLGHQAIAVASGCEVIQANEICHGKSDEVFHYQDELYQGLPAAFKVGRYHSLVVKKQGLPTILTMTAENKNKLIMGIRHRTKPIFGVQFHPESIMTPEGPLLLNNFLSICKHFARQTCN